VMVVNTLLNQVSESVHTCLQALERRSPDATLEEHLRIAAHTLVPEAVPSTGTASIPRVFRAVSPGRC
jgi:hypothetical protein